MSKKRQKALSKKDKAMMKKAVIQFGLNCNRHEVVNIAAFAANLKMAFETINHVGDEVRGGGVTLGG